MRVGYVGPIGVEILFSKILKAYKSHNFHQIVTKLTNYRYSKTTAKRSQNLIYVDPIEAEILSYKVLKTL